MCGFAAMLRTDSGVVEPTIVQRMTEVIRHRGPDDEGFFFSGPLGMGFRRLSILDVSPLGHQPMSSEDGQTTVVFNGEIYNYVELRQELEALGERFRSSGDTEVLLKAYRRWGTRCVERFNGMWAFLIYDERSGKLFGSRDRFGIKPLYRHVGSTHVLFASEIKAIRASGLYMEAPNLRSAAHYLLRDGLDESTESFYAGIESIPAGVAFELDPHGRFRQWRYWSLEPGRAIQDPAQAFGELFEDAVRLHMRSDVPVGVNLSGGLDSTSIICSAARIRGDAAANPLMAFCYQAAEFDERAYIADTLRLTGATLVDLETSPEALWNDLDKMLWHQDEPVHSMTAVIGFQLMRLAAQNNVKVILNGQGADETIGGYPDYFRHYWHTLLRSGHLVETWKEIARHSRAHGGRMLRLVYLQLRHLVQATLRSIEPYRSSARWAEQRRWRAASRWFDPGLVQLLEPQDRAGGSDLASVLRQAVAIAPLPLYLRVEDRNSMAHSVEARLPFLDYRLVSLLFSFPPDWHLRGPWNKFVLREAMRGRIPDSVRTRVDKMGFPLPARKWFSHELREPLFDILRSRAARERGIYKVDVLLRDAENGEIDVTGHLFRVAQFELWCTMNGVRATSTTPLSSSARAALP